MRRNANKKCNKWIKNDWKVKNDTTRFSWEESVFEVNFDVKSLFQISAFLWWRHKAWCHRFFWIFIFLNIHPLCVLSEKYIIQYVYNRWKEWNANKIQWRIFDQIYHVSQGPIKFKPIIWGHMVVWCRNNNWLLNLDLFSI